MFLPRVSGATLNFEVDLMNIGDSPPAANVFKEIDADKDKLLSREEVSKFLVRSCPCRFLHAACCILHGADCTLQTAHAAFYMLHHERFCCMIR